MPVRTSRITAACLALLAGLAVSQPAPRVAALHPVELPADLANPEPVRLLIEQSLAARLEAAGYRVIRAAESAGIWKRLVDSVGGFYDPLTGDTVRAEYDAVHHGTLRGLAARFGATLWLRPGVEVAAAAWKGGRAEWDGASEGVAPVGKGRVPALSLVVAAEDTSGALVAEGRGGIQVLSKVKGERYVEVPRDKLFADRKRVEKAVALALAPLAGGAGP